jgi:hypothetical protein
VSAREGLRVPTSEEIWDEILRIRDRIHEITSTIAAFKLEIDASIRWRDEADRWRKEINQLIGELMKADEIADAVAERLNKRRGLELTMLQKLAAAIVGLSALAASIKSLFF